MDGGASEVRPGCVSIISATRHEASNVGLLAKRLSSQLVELPVEWELMFIDDSDDDTPRVVASMARRDPRIRLLHRPVGHRPGGLSGALTLGLDATTGENIVVIDADLQHPPELVPTLVESLLAGADIAIASRYIAGGSAEGLSGPMRHTISRASTGVTHRLFARTRSIHDPVSGFFALHRRVISDVDLRPEGFKMLVEILVRGRWERCTEVPYHFAGREYGISKVSPALGFAFGRHILRLWLETAAPAPLRGRFPQNPAHPSGPVLDENHPRWSADA